MDFAGFPSSRQIRGIERPSVGAHRRHGASERDAQRRANARVAVRERAERGARADRVEDEAGRPVLPERQRGPGHGRQRRRRLALGQGSKGRHDTRRSAALKRERERSRFIFDDENVVIVKPQVPGIEVRSSRSYRQLPSR